MVIEFIPPLDNKNFSLSPQDQKISLRTEQGDERNGYESRLVIYINGSYTVEWFKILLNRAMGNWDNAPWELKEFADMFIDGEVKQDYKSQELQTITRPPKAMHN